MQVASITKKIRESKNVGNSTDKSYCFIPMKMDDPIIDYSIL